MTRPLATRRWDVQRYLDDLLRRMTAVERRVSRLRFDPPQVKAEATLSITDLTNFAIWEAGSEPRVYRRGDAVFFIGAARGLTAGYIDGTTERQFCRIPLGFRPTPDAYDVTDRLQGSGNNSWLLRIYSGFNGSLAGAVNASRYGPGASGTATWLPFAHSWITEDPAP